MPNDTTDVPPAPTLRERLQARGAKPHRRMSDLSRYMIAHHDELHALITVDRYGWADIAALLAEEEGLTDETGKPVTADIAKLTWSRLNRRRHAPVAPGAAAPSAPAVTPLSLPPAAATNRDAPPADPERPPMTIRPARPRGASARSSPPEQPATSTPSLLSEDAVARRLADLADRQGGAKIPPPTVL